MELLDTDFHPDLSRYGATIAGNTAYLGEFTKGVSETPFRCRSRHNLSFSRGRGPRNACVPRTTRPAAIGTNLDLEDPPRGPVMVFRAQQHTVLKRCVATLFPMDNVDALRPPRRPVAV